MTTGRGFRFVPDEAGIKEVSTGDGVADFLTDVAGEAAARVRARGPKGDDFFDYGSSVKAVPAYDGPDGTEAGVQVGSPGWHLPEYGTARISPRAPLRKGVSEIVDFKEGE